MGLALLTLLICLTRAMSADECADGRDGSCKAVAKPSDEGWGFFIAMGLMLTTTWAMGFFMGWVAKDLVQMKAPTAAPATAVQGAAAAAAAERATTRTMAAQAPTTYTWHRAEPRFLPLAESKAGAWLGD